MEILFWRHSTSSQKRRDVSTIYLRLTINGQREEIGSTFIKIHNSTWLEESQRISDQDPMSNFKNEQLSLMEGRLWAIYNDLLRKGQSVTAEKVRVLYVVPDSITYMATFGLFQKEYDANPKIAESSRKTLKNIRTLVLRYLIHENRQNILIEDFDEDVMKGYQVWAQNEDYEESYIIRSSRGIKQITSYAKRKKLILEDPLVNFKISHEKLKRPEYVDSIQLTVWRKHEFMHPTAQIVADLFVLYARTGFHYQDLMQIIKDPDEYIYTGIDSNQWIIKPRQKTQVDAKLPIQNFMEIKEIVDKYQGWKNLPTFTNSTMNMWLKVCAAEVNLKLNRAQRIYPKLSVKHGRTSFCDYCLNELGIARDALLTMMGRVSAAELERYVRGDERGVVTAFGNVKAMAS
ncbi:phage integrase SAM-like domain-containing protein [Dyadobacter frigoris]|uniref:phage integrase SAM-like domain-containing protein n=1 Tax=Dyadobacter frigoris TaxID=2576211 RepID=UPI0025572251|nr:phage integrase SAM-like domain-containing protein [Dyadobacter frigoris]